MTPSLQHVGVFRITPNAFAQIALARDPPTLVLTRREIVNALDRCRGIIILVVATADGVWHSVHPTQELVPRLRAALGLASSAVVPDVHRLLDALEQTDPTRLELPARRGDPDVQVPHTVRRWAMPHPAAVRWDVYWPGPCVAALSERLLGTDEFRRVYDLCRRTTLVGTTPVLVPTPVAVHTLFSDAPALPLLLGALCSSRVRARWLTHRFSIGAQRLWAYVLHRLLVRAVSVYWQTDAQAAEGLTGLHGMSAVVLPAPRLSYAAQSEPDVPERLPRMRFEDTLDGSQSVPTPDEIGAEPDLMGACTAVSLRLDAAHPWHRVASARVAADAAACSTGFTGQAVCDLESGEWWLVAECRLTHFIHAFYDRTMAVPIERRRVCRSLGFYTEGETVPAGSVVIGTMSGAVLSVCDNRFSRALVYNLVDTAPDTLVDSPARLNIDHVPRIFWPLVGSDTLLHPLRSESYCLRAGAHWWRCDRPGPSVCLDPPLRASDISAVLNFQNAHAHSSAPAPTSLFTCTPPSMASRPCDLPEWAQCRVGCDVCAIGEPVAYNGDAALLCRQELPCVLWWHWVLAAERLLCSSSRASEFAQHWFLIECRELHAALQSVQPVAHAPAVSSGSTSVVPRTTATAFGGTSVTLRNGATWSVPTAVVEEGARCERAVAPLDALVIFLLWTMSGESCRNEAQWSRVGIALRQVDPDGATVARHAFQWWSRKYGGAKYREDRDFGTTNPWWGRRPVYSDYAPERALSALIKYAKADRGVEKLTYDREAIAQALREFWHDGAAWWGN